jgi:hypothetical protein
MAICETALLCLSFVASTPAGATGGDLPKFEENFLRTSGSAMAMGAVASMLFQGSTAAVAENASLVQFSIYGGKLYFRNLHVFNAAWSGCCYNYYIDLTTDDGESMYAYFMMQYVSHGRVVFWRGSTAPGPIEQIGNWS